MKAVAAAEAVDPIVEGYDETMPGQDEIVAGTPEHVRVLNAYPNATSYGPDVNVVLPPVEEPPPDPPTTLGGAAQHPTAKVETKGDKK